MISMAATYICTAQVPAPPVSIAINAPENVKAGVPVEVGITVKNLSSVVIGIPGDLYTERGEIRLRGEFSFDLDVQDAEGNSPPETDFMKAVRHEHDGPGSPFLEREPSEYLALEPGDVVKGGTDLNKLFKLKPGKYTITLQRTRFELPRKSDLSGLVGQPPPHPRAYGGIRTDPAQEPPIMHSVVTSNTITITVTP
jgi:hypothetical protein